jgi:hypothetical protein
MVRYGTCKPKSVAASGTYTSNLYVKSNDGDCMNTNVQTWSGSSTNPFCYIPDAIQKSIELAAPYTKSVINIILIKDGSKDYHWLGSYPNTKP